jgi:hypothetical protein
MEYSTNLFQKKQHHLLMSHIWNFLTLVSMYRVVHMNNNIQQVHTVVACMSSVWKYIVHLKKIRSPSKKTLHSHMTFSRILRFTAYSSPETPCTLENVMKTAPGYALPFIIHLLVEVNYIHPVPNLLVCIYHLEPTTCLCTHVVSHRICIVTFHTEYHDDQ